MNEETISLYGQIYNLKKEQESTTKNLASLKEKIEATEKYKQSLSLKLEELIKKLPSSFKPQKEQSQEDSFAALLSKLYNANGGGNSVASILDESLKLPDSTATPSIVPSSKESVTSESSTIMSSASNMQQWNMNPQQPPHPQMRTGNATPVQFMHPQDPNNMQQFQYVPPGGTFYKMPVQKSVSARRR